MDADGDGDRVEVADCAACPLHPAYDEDVADAVAAIADELRDEARAATPGSEGQPPG